MVGDAFLMGVIPMAREVWRKKGRQRLRDRSVIMRLKESEIKTLLGLLGPERTDLRLKLEYYLEAVKYARD